MDAVLRCPVRGTPAIGTIALENPGPGKAHRSLPSRRVQRYRSTRNGNQSARSKLGRRLGFDPNPSGKKNVDWYPGAGHGSGLGPRGQGIVSVPAQPALTTSHAMAMLLDGGDRDRLNSVQSGSPGISENPRGIRLSPTDSKQF